MALLQQRLGISSSTTTPFASVFTLPTLATNTFANPAGAALVTHVDLADLPPSDQVSAITTAAGVAQTSLNISTGPS